jgi:multidrug efflux pump subunit AcrA (membrane-fusion protein)
MTVDVKVHESYVKKVVKGQKARITVDAFPDTPLTGEVFRIAVLPDSQNRWMNPDLKVYATSITVDGQHDWLKPGMSAEGEIVIEILKDVVKVPLQAVSQEGTETVVYLASKGMERRKVVTGSFDTSFIEIKEGLEAGDLVALRSPSSKDSNEKGKDSEEEKEEEKEESAPAAEAPKTPEAA